MKYITVKLTEDQLELIIGILDAAWWADDNSQTRAFKQRTINKLAKAKTV
jgi:hypothetical protein